MKVAQAVHSEFSRFISNRKSPSPTAKLLSGLGSRLVLLVLLLHTSSTFGVVIYMQGKINGESDVLNTGTFFTAINLGSGSPAVVVNGVAFGASNTAGLSGFVPGDPADFSTQFAPASPLDAMLSELHFQNGASASLTLSGLTGSQQYMLQMFLCNQVNTTAKSSRVTIQGQTYDIVNFGNDANYIRASFTASGSTEVIAFGKGSTFEPNRMILNGYALSAVPEPATSTLLATGVAALLARRRKKRQ
jgi:hypothetical protein